MEHCSLQNQWRAARQRAHSETWRICCRSHAENKSGWFSKAVSFGNNGYATMQTHPDIIRRRDDLMALVRWTAVKTNICGVMPASCLKVRTCKWLSLSTQLVRVECKSTRMQRIVMRLIITYSCKPIVNPMAPSASFDWTICLLRWSTGTLTLCMNTSDSLQMACMRTLWESPSEVDGRKHTLAYYWVLAKWGCAAEQTTMSSTIISMPDERCESQASTTYRVP